MKALTNNGWHQWRDNLWRRQATEAGVTCTGGKTWQAVAAGAATQHRWLLLA